MPRRRPVKKGTTQERLTPPPAVALQVERPGGNPAQRKRVVYTSPVMLASNGTPSPGPGSPLLKPLPFVVTPKVARAYRRGDAEIRTGKTVLRPRQVELRVRGAKAATMMPVDVSCWTSRHLHLLKKVFRAAGYGTRELPFPYVVTHPRHVGGIIDGVNAEDARHGEGQFLVELSAAFKPLSVLYLLARVSPQTIDSAFRLGKWQGVITLIAGHLADIGDLAAANSCEALAMLLADKLRRKHG